MFLKTGRRPLQFSLRKRFLLLYSKEKGFHFSPKPKHLGSPLSPPAQAWSAFEPALSSVWK